MVASKIWGQTRMKVFADLDEYINSRVFQTMHLYSNQMFAFCRRAGFLAKLCLGTKGSNFPVHPHHRKKEKKINKKKWAI